MVVVAMRKRGRGTTRLYSNGRVNVHACSVGDGDLLRLPMRSMILRCLHVGAPSTCLSPRFFCPSVRLFAEIFCFCLRRVALWADESPDCWRRNRKTATIGSDRESRPARPLGGLSVAVTSCLEC